MNKRSRLPDIVRNKLKKLDDQIRFNSNYRENRCWVCMGTGIQKASDSMGYIHVAICSNPWCPYRSKIKM